MKTFAVVLLVVSAAVAPAAKASTVDASCGRPVILLHGTANDSRGTWRELTAELRKDKRCVYAPDYGNRARNPIALSAKEIGAYVDRVLADTGSSEVDIVGYSQGGVVARHYLKFLGGTTKVNSVISIASPHHGIPGTLPDWLVKRCPACSDQLATSPFMKALNDGGDLVGSVRYTTIGSRHDGLVPLASQTLSGPADRVTNVVVQDTCPLDFTGHGQMTHARPVIKWTVNALRRGGLADPAHRAC
ncbi:lipase family alpha/beta hydrolase [Allokutzneria albata]|uniref:Lipase (Class 2) n=1 Tax=Allokutzneria albata TaxID=211114 RepID=A0A1H0C628_ALLAB|nr:alpha/beta fold hydrolase [Allokutzneria albata]SDN53328.1 Lipase (class 2) [Allokutzneria albata]